MKIILKNIEHNKAGYEELAKFNSKVKACLFETIEINFQDVNWFDADMCAAFGAILYNLGDKLNTIQFTNMSSQIEKILAKNGFLSHFGYRQISDNWGTTISYHRFDVKDDRAFAEYVVNEFLQRPEIPTMSPLLRNRFQKNIFEIFNNSVTHSNTKLGIFSCGQYFPNRHTLNFSIVDLGIGIRQNIQNNIGLKLTDEEAIIWATSDRNTTKRGQVPGGLGLKLLSEFIDINGGCIQIVSECGYWSRKQGKIKTEKLIAPFPGTVVNIEINSNDTASYMLAAEITTENIF
ncbi:hypothetical protein [Legionella sp. CNM-4043-24]|uniref:hypothetical protein n=1 Tax=Legionella sp. CNM-4043-24 TaxID=3421646 RepID=UPI00403B0E4F